jgi:hypothetical protein
MTAKQYCRNMVSAFFFTRRFDILIALVADRVASAPISSPLDVGSTSLLDILSPWATRRPSKEPSGSPNAHKIVPKRSKIAPKEKENNRPTPQLRPKKSDILRPKSELLRTSMNSRPQSALATQPKLEPGA